MISDSPRRIVIKLLVTYFQRNHSKEVVYVIISTPILLRHMLYSSLFT